MKTKLTVQFPAAVSELLGDLAEQGDTTKTVILQRAIGLYAFVVNESRKGRKIAVIDDDDRVMKELVFTEVPMSLVRSDEGQQHVSSPKKGEPNSSVA